MLERHFLQPWCVAAYAHATGKPLALMERPAAEAAAARSAASADRLLAAELSQALGVAAQLFKRLFQLLEVLWVD